MNQKAHVSCNFNYLVETERRVLTSRADKYKHCIKCGCITEMVQNRDVITADI